MKTLSVRQPWASMIAEGEKTIEVRSWPTKHRGALLVCASQKRDAGATKEQPVGVALVVVDLVECRTLEPADAGPACIVYRPGVFAWVVRVLYAVEQVPVRGRLGLFESPLTIKRLPDTIE